jgi:hypothetical protein
MHTKAFFQLLFFVLIVVSAFSQNALEDVVYLKNGSVIRGQIREQKTGKSLKIEITGGSIFVLRQDEIDSIRKEKAWQPLFIHAKRTYYRREKGFRNISETGVICGFATGQSARPYDAVSHYDFGFMIRNISGYQWSCFLFTGAGLGIDRFITYKQTFSPFFFRAGSEFLRKKVTPLLFADIGYAIMWASRNDEYVINKNKGGIYFSSGGGIRIFTPGAASVLMFAAYRINKSYTRWQYTFENSPVYHITRIYQRVVFGIGISL